jgi:hypothetical protein
MSTIDIKITALSHCNWKDNLAQLQRDFACGNGVLLKRDHDNVDPSAVQAFYMGKTMGYVCSEQASLCCDIMQQKGAETLIARAADFVEKPYRHCRVMVDVEDERMTTQTSENQIYKDWSYSGPVLRLNDEMQNLNCAYQYLDYVIRGELPWDETVEESFKTFLKFHRHSFSDEIFQFRIRLSRWMNSNDDPRVQRCASIMATEFFNLRPHENRQWVIDFIKMLPHTEEFQHMLLVNDIPDTSLLMSELQQCPGHLYRLFYKSPDDFASVVYYHHPPQNVLRRLFSALALCEHFQLPYCDESVRYQQHMVNNTNNYNNYGVVNNAENGGVVNVKRH